MAEVHQPTRVVRSHCNSCKGQRNHAILETDRKTWNDEEQGISGGDVYGFLKCCGCDAVQLRHQSWFSEDMDDDGTPVVTTRYYPPKVDRHEPRWFQEDIWLLMFDSPIRKLLEEIYRAVAADAPRLAAMGIRALLETAMIEQSMDAGTFDKNLDALKAKGLVSAHQLKQMSDVIEVGHAAIHRRFEPNQEELLMSLDVAENIIEALYITPARASKLTNRVPPRKPVGRAKQSSTDRAPIADSPADPTSM